MTQHYIGCKQIVAWPQEKDGSAGYAVRYPDGYTSWSPKETFDKAYLPMGEGSDGTTVTQAMVDDFIHETKTMTMGKTTIVVARLCNGFEMVESSSCVDAKNYDEQIGADICIERIKDRVWGFLGFLLQTCRFGVRGQYRDW